jgi:hypothetical protein
MYFVIMGAASTGLSGDAFPGALPYTLVQYRPSHDGEGVHFLLSRNIDLQIFDY